MSPGSVVTINRAPVLVLWAAIVAEALGHDRDEALTLGKAVAGLNAQSKGRSLGIFRPREAEDGEPAPRSGLGEDAWVEILGRPVPVRRTDAGVRAVVKDEAIDPAKVQSYLERAFGTSLGEATDAMRELAASCGRAELEARGYDLYVRFRPAIPAGKPGWGAKGELDIDLIRGLAR